MFIFISEREFSHSFDFSVSFDFVLWFRSVFLPTFPKWLTKKEENTRKYRAVTFYPLYRYPFGCGRNIIGNSNTNAWSYARFKVKWRNKEKRERNFQRLKANISTDAHEFYFLNKSRGKGNSALEWFIIRSRDSMLRTSSVLRWRDLFRLQYCVCK